MSKNKHPETIALHGGDYRSDPATTAVAVPLSIEQHLINLMIQIMLQIYSH